MIFFFFLCLIFEAPIKTLRIHEMYQFISALSSVQEKMTWTGVQIMALPADGVPVSGGRLHVVAVTVRRGPFLPRLTAGLHQLLGRHWIEMKPLSAASALQESHIMVQLAEVSLTFAIAGLREWRRRFDLEPDFFVELLSAPPPPPLKAENSSKYEMFLILDSFTLLRSNKSLWQGNLSLILRLIRAETEMMRRESAPPFKVGQEKDQQAGNRGVLLCLQ